MEGQRVRAKRVGWDGSLIGAPDGPYYPEDHPDAPLVDLDDRIPVGEVEGWLSVVDVPALGFEQHIVHDDRGGQIIVDPATVVVQ